MRDSNNRNKFILNLLPSLRKFQGKWGGGGGGINADVEKKHHPFQVMAVVNKRTIFQFATLKQKNNFT